MRNALSLLNDAMKLDIYSSNYVFTSEKMKDLLVSRKGGQEKVLLYGSLLSYSIVSQARR